MTLLQFHEALAAICPIHGVNSDKVIWFMDEATPEQRAAAQAFADGVELDDGPDVPLEVTMRQARLALASIGKLAEVDAVIDALPEPDRTAARIEWEYSASVQRRKALVLTLAPKLGLDDAALDSLFTQAATL